MRHASFSSIVISSVAILMLSVATWAQAEDYAVDAKTGLRMERYRGPVPQSVPGAKTVDTKFVQSLVAAKEAVLLDVYPPKGLGPDPLSGVWITPEIRQSIPGAHWLPDVGRGFLEAELEDYFQRNLERLTKQNKNTAVVFFCTADCWQSWNASVRAVRWGYTNVHWYPTGTDGWQEHDQPVVTVQPINYFAGNDDNVKSPFPAAARILLFDKHNNELDIGEVRFVAADDGRYGIDVNVSSDSFNDHFLSMRPFKCIDGSAEWFCHQPYPYTLNNVVTATDVSDLEYHLLFIRKSPKDFGIDAWDGLYFKLAQQDDGLWHGRLLEGDLNVLQSPPANDEKPIELSEFIDADIDRRRFVRLLLKPTS